MWIRAVGCPRPAYHVPVSDPSRRRTEKSLERPERQGRFGHPLPATTPPRRPLGSTRARRAIPRHCLTPRTFSDSSRAEDPDADAGVQIGARGLRGRPEGRTRRRDQDRDAQEGLRHEARVLSALRWPHIVRCLGSRAAGGEYQLFLEFAPGGSLADEAARSAGGRISERDVRRHAADVARGLAYLHGEESLVHGDVKAANVVVGADGRAKLADFGCARPAFMAPEVARGEEQGPPADVWALACTVIEIASGAAPWSDADDGYAAVHRIAYTDAVSEVPAWLSSEAKDFLRVCLQRNPGHRPSASQVLDHPFLVSAEPAKHGWASATASPKITLNVEFWDSDNESATGRISSLVSPRSALPDWDSEDGWIHVHSEESYQPHISELAGAGFDAAEVGIHAVDVDVEEAIKYPTCHVGGVKDFVKCQQRHSSLSVGGGIGLCLCPVACPQGKTVDRNSVVLVITNEKSSLNMHKSCHFVDIDR